MSKPAIFSSMGMLIIDEIHFPSSSKAPSHYNILGGGGTFAALGARIVTPSAHSQEIGWFVDKGSDFPLEVEEYLKGWDTGAIWRYDSSRLTTRGWNLYHEDEFREFKYLTEKKRITVDDLIHHEALLKSKSYHLICSPLRCLEILDKLYQERTKLRYYEPPKIIWEVVPDLCNPENLADVKKVLPKVDVFTPNAEEGARLFGSKEPKDAKELEELASRFLPFVKGGIVLRCGPFGCYTLTHSTSHWWPAYQNEKNPDRKVIDPTGGGNTFIGAFAAGFVLSDGDWDIGSVCGNIGAGVAIEQIGMPEFDGLNWNRLGFKERLERYFKFNDIDLQASDVLQKLGHDLKVF